jgi:Carboxypeptidase Taq (M32) metallopeptidase
MRPFLEQAVDLSREYAVFFAPYQHVADPLIDAAEEGMTTASIRSLFAELRSELLPIVHAISEQPIPSDDCLRGSFSAKSISGTRCSQQCTSQVMRFTSRELPQRLTARRLDREHRSAYTRASRGSGKMSSAAAARSGSIGPARYLPGSFPADRIRDLLSGDQQGATLLDPHGCLIVAGCGGEFIFGSRASDLQIAALNKEASEARLALEKIRNPSSLSGLTDDSDIR